MNAKLASRSGRLAGGWVVTAVFCFPIYLAVVNAFKANAQIKSDPLGLPNPFTFSNVITALSRPDHLIQTGLVNSVVITSATVALLIPLSSATSLWLFERSARVKGILTGIFALGLMIPPQVGLQPTVQVLKAMGLMNTYPGLVLVGISGGYFAFAVFVYVGFLHTVPKEILDSARVDGAGDLRVWWSIVMPLMRPATITVAIFVGLWTWNDFLGPLIILGPTQGQTITVAMYLSLGASAVSTDYGQVYAITLIAALIPLIAYLFCQREFVAGLTSGAAKG
ncbi:MAG: carbohydrate ABC transporter permease [Bifidobacteriaceae bacterium]|nr:carbohydrate ABC transporter permease [Bifidobacteriaceae bacterium]